MTIRTENTSRRGSIAVIVSRSRLLVIRRSQQVIAPGAFCFPGGGIEPNETEQEALIRELREELDVEVRPIRRLWECVSRRGIHLAWWQGELIGQAQLTPNPAEVESVHWFTLDELRQLPDLLGTNRLFLDAVASGDVELAV